LNAREDCIIVCAELAKEGETSDMMAIVKSGECRIICQTVSTLASRSKALICYLRSFWFSLFVQCNFIVVIFGFQAIYSLE